MIISAQIRLFFLFVHDEQNEVLSINNKKLSFRHVAPSLFVLRCFPLYATFMPLVFLTRAHTHTNTRTCTLLTVLKDRQAFCFEKEH